MITRISLLTAILVSLTISPAVTENALELPNAPDSFASTSSFYSFRRDVRRCASPRCGGYFIKLVNQARMRCADNRYQSECYVSRIEWGGQSEPDNTRGLLRGTVRSERTHLGRFGVLHVSEVWQASSETQPTGIVYRVRDNGIRCIAAPCESYHEAKLNSTASREVADVELGGAGAPDNIVSEATQAMTSPDGILVNGVHRPVRGPAGRSQMLKAEQFYVRAKGSTSNSQKPCRKTGCSSQVCSDEEVITTCEWRREYECYQKATCERQPDGKCGFTPTRELTFCLRGR